MSTLFHSARDMWDIQLELLRALVIALILLFCYRVGKQTQANRHKGWGYILLGWGLIFIGSLFDITDNFENLNRFIIIGDTPAQAFIEKFVGFLLGYVSLFIGLIYWIPANNRYLEKTKDNFISSITHGIKTPLTSIFGSLQLIQHSPDTQKLSSNLRQTLDIAIRNSERLKQVVEDILDMQHLESGMLMLDLQHHEINSLIEEALKTNQGHATKYRTRFQPHYSDKELFALVDETRFLQVLGNLLSNAAKFTRYQTVIDIHVRCNKNKIHISVHDYGPGMTDEYQQRIFTPFAQFSGDGNEQRDGTGLGLALSQRLLAQMDGRITLSSEIGRGSTFDIELPLTQGECAEE